MQQKSIFRTFKKRSLSGGFHYREVFTNRGFAVFVSTDLFGQICLPRLFYLVFAIATRFHSFAESHRLISAGEFGDCYEKNSFLAAIPKVTFLFNPITSISSEEENKEQRFSLHLHLCTTCV